MIEYFKNIFNKPVIEQTPKDKFIIFATVCVTMIIIFIIAFIVGCIILKIKSNRRNK